MRRYVVYIDAFCGPGFETVSEGDGPSLVPLYETLKDAERARVETYHDLLDAALDKWESGDLERELGRPADLSDAFCWAAGDAEEWDIGEVEVSDDGAHFWLRGVRYATEGGEPA